MHERSGASMMTRREKVRNVSLLVLGVCVVVGTGMAYRAVVERWKGDLRGTLIAAAFAGIAFFVSTVLTLSWAGETRRLEEAEAPKLTASDTFPARPPGRSIDNRPRAAIHRPS